MSNKIAPEAALPVLEVLTNRVGVKLEVEERLESLHAMLMDVNVAFLKLVNAAEKEPQLVADQLIELSATCVIAVASMVAGSNVSAVEKEVVADAIDEVEEKLTPDEQRAFDIMQERMKAMRGKLGPLLS